MFSMIAHVEREYSCVLSRASLEFSSRAQLYPNWIDSALPSHHHHVMDDGTCLLSIPEEHLYV